ncbi:Ubiquitin carboxyl-terminal hydrolase 47-like isoform x1 [Globisporangium polare]
MTEVTEQTTTQQAPGGDVRESDDDIARRHRQQMQSALSALPAPRDDDADDAFGPIDQIYDNNDGYDNSGYDRYVAPYTTGASSSPAGPISTALTLYSEEDSYEEPGYAHLFDSPNDEEEGPAPKPSYTAYARTPVVKNPFTGLSNQGATCYMNSLLQTMFMTPEFRKGLYQWKFGRAANKSKASDGDEQQQDSSTNDNDDDEDEAEEDNIPFQLQKLFAKLQVSEQESISTKALTKSFGWTGADVFQQHDVQELCRVLFDAIERSFKGTVNETLVNDLYQGTLKDYVQCHTCGYESSRIDNFLDLSLVIRPFGSEEMMKSVEEAIELFLRPELLNKENQWMCDKCQTKRDAIKGLKFSKLPYLLSLQLKRFDFDYATMNRIKLHNQVTFPKYLDMNSYVSDHASGARGRGKIARKMSMERHELEATASQQEGGGAAVPRAYMRRLSSMDESQALQVDGENVDSDSENEDVGDDANHQNQSRSRVGSTTVLNDMDTWSSTFDPQEMIKRNGPHVYELYSVLIHSGSALGGHYYAYIKSFETGKWFNFNDSHVSEISDDELKTAFGGGSGGSSSYGGRMSYSTCAYMLMYRLVSTEKNVNEISKASIPEYLQQKFQADEERARLAEQERLEMAKKVMVRFFMKGSKPKNVEKTIHLYKTTTIREALAAGCEAFAKEKDVVIPASLENVRLRGYNDYNALLSDTFDGKEDSTLTSLGVYTGQQLFIEVKSASEQWEAYDPFKLQLFVRRFVDTGDDEDEAKRAAAKDQSGDLLARCIQVDDTATLGTLCAVIAQKFSVAEGRKVRLLTKSGYSTTPVKLLNKSEDNGTLNLRLRMNLHLTNGTEVYMEETDDLASPSPAKEFFEREANMIVVNFKYLSRAAEPIRIDRRETVAALKQRISAKIGLAPDNFKVLRGVNSAGVEIKTVDSTLYNLSIGSNNVVFVLEGVPLNRGEYNFRLVLHRPPVASSKDNGSSLSMESQLTVVSSNPESSDDNERLYDVDEVLLTSGKDDAEFVAAGQVIISEEMQVADIRKRVHTILLQRGLLPPDVATDPRRLRLRDVRQNTMTQILIDGKKLLDASDSAVYEARGLVAQILPEPESAGPDHRVVEFVYVDRSTWRFSKTRRCEVVVSRETQLAHPLTYLAEVASEKFTIPVERLRFARIPYHRDSCDILEVVSYQFHTAEDLMTRTPDYQELVLVIDDGVPLEYMTHRERLDIQRFLAKKSEEKAKAQRAKYSSVSSSSGGGGYQYQKPKEAALVIRTKSREKKGGGGSNASSSGGGQAVSGNGVSIRTPSSRKAAAADATANASSDTDEEDEEEDGGDDFIDKSDAADATAGVLADLDLLDNNEARGYVS